MGLKNPHKLYREFGNMKKWLRLTDGMGWGLRVGSWGDESSVHMWYYTGRWRKTCSNPINSRIWAQYY